MAPSLLLSTAASLWTRCSGVFCTIGLTRGGGLLPASSTCVKWLSTAAINPPKRPVNAFMLYMMQQKPNYDKEKGLVVFAKKLSKQWKGMSPEQKRPFEEAYAKAREKYYIDREQFIAQLTPGRERQLAQEMKKKIAKSMGIKRKRELNILGKPKGPRSSFNVFMSEHYQECRGSNAKEKMHALVQDWYNMTENQKKVYRQLAEDDKIRYKNEITSWEEHMIEIGREDLIRHRTRRERARQD